MNSLVCTAAQRGRGYSQLCCIEEECEAQRGCVACTRAHSYEVEELGFEPQSLASEPRWPPPFQGPNGGCFRA